MSTTHVDHIIYAAHNLDSAVDRLADLLGVRATFGGQHLGVGSHNALLSLGGRSYLEIIAADPNQPDPGRPRSFGIDTLETAGLVTWAAGTERIDAQVADARAAGFDPGKLIDGGRKKPNGAQLKWRSTKRPEALAGQPLPCGGLIPFLISWGDTPHPADNTPTGCTLLALRAEHPDPASVAPLLAALATPLSVTQGPHPQLIATIETPNGTVELR